MMTGLGVIPVGFSSATTGSTAPRRARLCAVNPNEAAICKYSPARLLTVLINGFCFTPPFAVGTVIGSDASAVDGGRHRRRSRLSR